MELSLAKSLFNSCSVALLCLQLAGLSSTVVWAQSSMLGGAAQTAPVSTTYSVTDLGTFEESLSTVGTYFGINDKGQVVGNRQTAGSKTSASGRHAFLWQGGNLTDLGTLGGAQARATAINNNGQVVGSSTTSDGSQHPFLWEDGRMIDLGTLGGTFGEAEAINDTGQVAGVSAISDGTNHPFLWEGGRMIDLGTLGGNGNIGGPATGINNRGQVVGWTGPQSFVWQNGQFTDVLGTLARWTYTQAINDTGQVAGFSVGDNVEDSHAFLWQNGQITDLGVGSAEGINNKGQVVGVAQTANFDMYAALWQDGKVMDLNTLIPPVSGRRLDIAAAINNVGQIVAVGSDRAYLLTPVHTVDADLQLSLPSWQFATHPIGETSGPGKIWIYNYGTQAATFSSIQFTGGDAKDFGITENTCGSTLAPFTTCKVIFQFTPTATGERNASLALNDNGTGGPHVIPVRGFGARQ